MIIEYDKSVTLRTFGVVYYGEVRKATCIIRIL